MDPVRWARIKEVFQAARECEPGRRDAVLQELCGDDQELITAVNTMLARDSSGASFLEAPALEVEARAMARAGSLPGTLEPVPVSLAPVQRRPRGPRPPWWMVFLGAVFMADFLLKTWCLVLGPDGFAFSSRIEAGRAVVSGVEPGGAAERADLRPGDVLVARDGRTWTLVPDRESSGPNLEVGRTYRFDILRDGRPTTVPVRVDRTRVLDAPYAAVTILWQVAAGVLLATALLIGLKRPRDGLALTGSLTMATFAVGLYRFNLPPGYAAYWRDAPLGTGALGRPTSAGSSTGT